MTTLYLDADACPVKAEAYKVAARHGWAVKVVANAPLGVPADPRVGLVVVPGFGSADDWIAGACGRGDVVVTADVPLAARAVAAGAVVIDPRGRRLTADTVGEALAVRDLMTDLRQAGVVTGGGPPPLTKSDRSRFLSALDDAMVAARKLPGGSGG